jgi:hypothetical protein
VVGASIDADLSIAVEWLTSFTFELIGEEDNARPAAVKNEHCDDPVASKEMQSIPAGGSLVVSSSVGGGDERVRVIFCQPFGLQAQGARHLPMPFHQIPFMIR